MLTASAIFREFFDWIDFTHLKHWGGGGAMTVIEICYFCLKKKRKPCWTNPEQAKSVFAVNLNLYFEPSAQEKKLIIANQPASTLPIASKLKKISAKT